jgi:hypothetical protein
VATVHALTGVALPLADFPSEASWGGFDEDLDLSPGPANVEAVARAAPRAAAAVARPGALPCSPGAGSEACGRELLATFGVRAFRRPLEPAEAEFFARLLDTATRASGFQDGVRLVVETLLQSPRLLYRLELSPGAVTATPGVLALDPWERATRLSYLLTGTLPDEALLAAARAGTLSRPEGVLGEARRMLGPPGGPTVYGDYFRQWVGLDFLEAPRSVPGWTPRIAGLMRQETERFVDEVMRTDGRLETLLTAPFTFMNGPLAAFLGTSGPTGEAFTRVELDPSRRKGLLTQASWLSINAHDEWPSPVMRGMFVHERVLCQDVPAPPAGVDAPVPVPSAVPTTNRELLTRSVAAPFCAICHDVIDPYGFAFEHYDAVGRWRDTDKGLPIDDSAVAPMPSIGAFRGAVELAEKLAASPEAAACAVQSWFRYAHGRRPTDGEACVVAGLAARFDEHRHDVRALLLALVESDTFLYRRATAAPPALVLSAPPSLDIPAGASAATRRAAEQRFVLAALVSLYEGAAAQLTGEEQRRLLLHVAALRDLQKQVRSP